VRLPNGADTEINCVALLGAPKNIRNETQSTTKSSRVNHCAGFENCFNFVPICTKVVKQRLIKRNYLLINETFSLFVDSLKHSQDFRTSQLFGFRHKEDFPANFPANWQLFCVN
jgi:hypothetical protein